VELRRSDRKVKVLEGPYELFVLFAAYTKDAGRSPSGPEAPDFRIVLSARPRHYLTTPPSLTPLTEREQIDVVG
jgi:hypothetical protein